MMKGLKIAGKVLLGIVISVVMILAMLHLMVTVIFFDYFDHAQGEFLIPGLNTAFVPQGFEYLPDQECYLISGYRDDGAASRVYVQPEDGEHYSVALLYEDGRPYAKHAGGICRNGRYVYLAGHDGVDVFLLEDILAGRDARKQGELLTGYDMAYCSFYNGYLLAGDFYDPKTYETPADHRIVTPAGDRNTGVMTVFKADGTAEFGIDPTPVAAFSTTGRVQGICFTGDDEIVLSTSYSIDNSHLYYYRIDTDRVGTIAIMEDQVPLYYLDSAALTDTVTLPPMSEELVYRDGRVYVMCGSACNKYFYGKFIRGYQVFSYENG